MLTPMDETKRKLSAAVKRLWADGVYAERGIEQ